MKIVIIDDEASIRRLLSAALRRGGHDPVEAVDAASGLQSVRQERPDMILLDLGLPDRDGLELIPLLRGISDAALLVISARDATAEKVAALDLGADDYITKPFDTEELLARLRTASRHRSTRVNDRLCAGPVEIDLGARIVKCSGVELHLTRKEFALLELLASHPGRVLTHGQILRQIWGPAHENDIEYVRVVVRSLRRKIEEDAARPRLIVNDPGIGYRFAV